MGLNCAACHVTQINYKGVGMRIDGGPGMGDVETMLHELAAALRATLDDSAKFDRFASKVLGGSTFSADQRRTLQGQLRNVTQYRELFDETKPDSHRYGFARVDAFGIILNKVLARDLDLPENLREANAPVSFPFLWDTPQHDMVQWNGSAPNAHLGSLARNVGEVLGVFGELSFAKHDTENIGPGYKSSVRVMDLLHIEHALRDLCSPQWPRQLPPIDRAKATRGQALFQKHCASCHAPIHRTDPSRTVKAHMTPIDALGTDPQMAMNSATRSGKTGRLEGKPKYVIVGSPMAATAAGDEILVNAIVGVILNSPFRDYTDSDLMNVRKKEGIPHVEAVSKPSYKARPLNGIWATAPYLHNGSVPSLYQLLLPAEGRVKDFYLGKREFDPVNVGFVSEKFEGGFHFRTTDDAGKPIPGNSNAGHEYGTGKDGNPALTDTERWEVVEYMKTL
jgi:mono/diheme cytochrome c family protein